MGGIEGRASPSRTVVPEDRVGDEPVQSPSAQYGPQLLPSTARRKVAPDDCVKAGGPVPLMSVTRGRRTGEPVASAVGQAALAPVAGEHAVRICSQPGDAPIADRATHRRSCL